MKIVSQNEFFAGTSNGFPLHANMSIYAGKLFECACGQTHQFSGLSSDVLRELPGMKFVFRCPKREAVTCVQIKGFFSPKIVSLFGVKDAEKKETEERIEIENKPENKTNTRRRTEEQTKELEKQKAYIEPFLLENLDRTFRPKINNKGSYSTVLLALSKTHCSYGAIRRAGELAGMHDAELIVLFIVPHYPEKTLINDIERLRHEIDEARRILDNGFDNESSIHDRILNDSTLSSDNLHEIIAAGDESKVLERIVDLYDADLLVLGNTPYAQRILEDKPTLRLLLWKHRCDVLNVGLDDNDWFDNAVRDHVSNQTADDVNEVIEEEGDAAEAAFREYIAEVLEDFSQMSKEELKEAYSWYRK